ncbi:MAG: DUF2828 family protein [Prevotellaceae bacterium]|nr:DUF2828 family protein [Candidatus Colivivens equi]
MTENGAIGYRTSGKELLDLNFAVASLRHMSDNDIADKFMRAFYENKLLAMKWLFFARDVREGLGERRFFRVVLDRLAVTNTEIVKAVISLIPEYGRFDDMWCLLDNDKLADIVGEFVYNQLHQDWRNMKNNQPISLLAKWMPSINASSIKTKEYAKKFCKMFNTKEATYRKTLSALRKYLDVVEIKMSAKNWSEINYETVPSRANLIYKDAFLRNDTERREEYLNKLANGEAKINSAVLYPHDIVHKYINNYGFWDSEVKSYDSAVEALWKALPDIVNGCDNTIVVADGSGSMNCSVGNTKITALEVANALAIYFAEHSSGEFKDKYITFSSRPQFVDFSNCNSLHDKLAVALQHNECSNTNVEAVFDLILSTAVNNHMSQNDIPKNILIISDMEFDGCAKSNSSWDRPNARLFEEINSKYVDAGYKMPRLVFWNVNSRTGTIPVKENDLGVALVSGFSVNVVKMVMSGKLDPYECLLETLNTERYKPIEEALKNI